MGARGSGKVKICLRMAWVWLWGRPEVPKWVDDPPNEPQMIPPTTPDWSESISWHLKALQPSYIKETLTILYCEKCRFLKLLLSPLRPTKQSFFWVISQFSLVYHMLVDWGKLRNHEKIASCNMFFCPKGDHICQIGKGSTVENLTLTFGPKIVSWLHHMYRDSQKNLGEKPNVKAFRVVP